MKTSFMLINARKHIYFHFTCMTLLCISLFGTFLLWQKNSKTKASYEIHTTDPEWWSSFYHSYIHPHVCWEEPTLIYGGTEARRWPPEQPLLALRTQSCSIWTFPSVSFPGVSATVFVPHAISSVRRYGGLQVEDSNGLRWYSYQGFQGPGGLVVRLPPQWHLSQRRWSSRTVPCWRTPVWKQPGLLGNF